jgi:hypothetical protein
MIEANKPSAADETGEDATRDAEIRAIAYRLWQVAAEPDGQADRLWDEAKEIWALKHADRRPTVAPPDPNPAEPTLALENRAVMPGLTDQGGEHGSFASRRNLCSDLTIEAHAMRNTSVPVRNAGIVTTTSSSSPGRLECHMPLR